MIKYTMAGGQPFRIFRLTNPCLRIIPLRYVNAEELVLAFRVPDPLRLSKGRGLKETSPRIKHLVRIFDRGQIDPVR
jgi:hypothetical protein